MKSVRHGGCHCGALRFEVELDLSAGTAKCNCTYCAKSRFWLVQVGAGRPPGLGRGDGLSRPQSSRASFLLPALRRSMFMIGSMRRTCSAVAMSTSASPVSKTPTSMSWSPRRSATAMASTTLGVRRPRRRGIYERRRGHRCGSRGADGRADPRRARRQGHARRAVARARRQRLLACGRHAGAVLRGRERAAERGRSGQGRNRLVGRAGPRSCAGGHAGRRAAARRRRDRPLRSAYART